jgi:hypothetical protein
MNQNDSGLLSVQESIPITSCRIYSECRDHLLLVNQLYGFAFNFTPRINYKISRRFNIDLNVPLKIYDLRLEKNQVNNPAIPIRQQNTNDVDHIFFESAYTIRLGLAYKFTR